MNRLNVAPESCWWRFLDQEGVEAMASSSLFTRLNTWFDAGCLHLIIS
ncbi:hypothetical protein SynA1825c_00149 [Synechococcus sp. A18-25c]|nr:hypothetical protein SynA1825c_00149 [Synechococcus sp. A18-25c]